MPKYSEEMSEHIPNYISPRWFEDARSPLWQRVNELSEAHTRFGTVRHASYDFKRELFAHSEVSIVTSIESIANSSAVCRQEAWQSGQLAVIATVVLVGINVETRNKAILSDAAKQYLKTMTK